MAIVENEASILRETAREVPKTMFKTSELAAILGRMSDELRNTELGVAIAAPQIGESWRIFVVRGFIMKNKARSTEDEDIVFINPAILRTSKKRLVHQGEGCLSVPDVWGTTQRPYKITIRAFDATGKKFERGGTDLLAQIFQHEIDHLNGILFIDHATDLHKRTKADRDREAHELEDIHE